MAEKYQIGMAKIGDDRGGLHKVKNERRTVSILTACGLVLIGRHISIIKRVGLALVTDWLIFTRDRSLISGVGVSCKKGKAYKIF